MKPKQRKAQFRKTYGRDFQQFADRIFGRLEQGSVEYEDRSFTHRRLSEVADELLEELEDVPGWSFVLWRRVKALQRHLPRGPRATIWTERSTALTIAGAQLWQYLFGEPIPDTISLRWVPYLRGRAGQADVGAIHHGGTAQFDYSYLRTQLHPVRTLLHEFAHLRGFGGHTKTFMGVVNKWCRALSIPEESF